MDLRRRRIAPMIGGVTAAATVAGAFAPATQVAVAAPDHASGAATPLGLAQEGVFESCNAYFGQGKGVVGFDVADVNGDDGTDHAVPDDVDVVLVLENEEGDTLECVPEEVEPAEWEEWVTAVFTSGGPTLPTSPVRYRYPTGPNQAYIDDDDFGRVTSVGFRVIGIPSEHTLVSPTGVQPLPDPYPSVDELVDDVPETSVLAFITEMVGADAAAAFSTAMDDCEVVLDDELLAALVLLHDELLGYEETTLYPCDVWWLNLEASLGLGLIEAAGHIEPIRLSVPEQETPTTPTTAPPARPGATGAQPVTAPPTYTG